MKANTLFRALSLALLLALAVVSVPSMLGSHASAHAALRTVIVELSGEPAVVAKYRAELQGQQFDVQAYRQRLVAAQDNLLARARAAGIDFAVAGVSAPNGDVTANIQFRFNYVYNGITLEVPEAAIAQLERMEGVVAVHPAEEMRADLDHAVAYTRASQLYGQPPRLTQFDEADTGGLEGEGMIVAVIDTGVDWTHAMFGGDPTPPQFGVGPQLATHNQKVIYYLNLTAGAAGDDFGHGTHVAADIAGYLGRAPGKDMLPLTADDVELHGVAPRARLMAYKTLSAAGAGLNPSTIMAVEDAVQPFTITGYPKPVPHVINLSLGSTTNDPNSPTSVACDNATLAGVTVVASAGNSGPGEATIGSPGSGRRVLTVGANNDPGPPAEDIVMDRVFDNGRPNDLTDVLNPAGLERSRTGLVDATNKATAEGQRTNIQINLGGGSPAVGNQVAQYYVFAGTVTSAADVPNSVAGRIAIARPSGAFAGVAAALAAKGAAAALIIRPDLAKITVGASVIPVWSIQETDARYLLDLLSSTDLPGVDPATGVLSEFPIRIKQGSFTPAMAAFSSRGPVGGYGQVKPDVTAPGVAILSATVRAGGVATSGAIMMNPTGYISASGTSFSSPITAGVVALIRQKNRQWTPAMIRAALTNTATNLRQANGTPLADGANSIIEQGGGLIDAAAAANTKALMGTGMPGPTGKAPAVRPFAVGVGPLVGTSPGNPDFSASYSFGSVPIASVIGSAVKSTTVNIYDVAEGMGAGVYQLSVSNVRGVDGTNFSVQITDPFGRPINSVEVSRDGEASFVVKTTAVGNAIADGTQFQWYVTATRSDGAQTLRMPFYYRAEKPVVATAAPSLNNVAGTEVAANPPVDINGDFQLQYAKPATGAEPAKYRIEESSDDGATWTTLGEPPASQLAYDVTGRSNGTYQYRVTGLYAVEHGFVVGPASATKSVRVDRRIEQDVTALVELVNKSITFPSGYTEITQALRNKTADTTLYPPARFEIVAIQSSGGVRVTNADNGGNGVESPAVFDYSGQFGAALAPAAESGTRIIRFSNPSSALFTFTARVFAHTPVGGATSSSTTASSTDSSGTQTGGTSSGGQTSPTGTNTLRQVLINVTVNPLTRTVSISR